MKSYNGINQLINSNINDQLNFLISQGLSTIHALHIGEITAINSEKNTLSVQILSNIIDMNGSPIKQSIINDVVIGYIGNSNTQIIVEYKVGDIGNIGFYSRDYKAVINAGFTVQNPASKSCSSMQSPVWLGSIGKNLNDSKNYIKIAKDGTISMFCEKITLCKGLLSPVVTEHSFSGKLSVIIDGKPSTIEFSSLSGSKNVEVAI
jgi:hypothetical protein